MKNREIAKIFRNIALLMEIKGDMVFKIRAYERAALLLESLEEDIEDIYKRQKLQELPGIGEALSEKIEEYIRTGRIQSYEDKKKKIPVDIEELDKVQGLGPKTIMKLYKLLSVKNIEDLEKAAKEGKIRKIKGLGPVVEQNILKSVSFAKQSVSRHLLGDAISLSERIKAKLQESKGIKYIDTAGSLRRKKETIGDIDIIAASKKPAKVIQEFTSLPDIEKILAKGNTKASIRLEGIQADLRVVDEKIYGAALLHFTGSKQHNIVLRKIALKKGMKVSEYGIHDKKTNKLLAGKTEEECYKKLGLRYIEPELREDNGEIEAAINNKLPNIINYNEVKGDLQMHTKWSDGNNTILEMAEEADKLGHEYILITDHVGKAGMGNAIPPEKLKGQKKEIEEAAKKTGIRILQGAEINIQLDGSVDVDEKYLKELDVVLGSIHFGFKTKKEQQTSRLIKAMENEYIDIIAHPTGRLLNERPGYDIDFDKILEKARATKTVLEINALQKRLDLNDVYIRAAVKAGVKMSIGTDSHDTLGLKNYILGVAMARRGWAEKKDIVNAYSLKEMLDLLK